MQEILNIILSDFQRVSFGWLQRQNYLIAGICIKLLIYNLQCTLYSTLLHKR